MEPIGVVPKSWLTASSSLEIITASETDPIMVIGLPRSGTSRIAGLLHQFGIFMGTRFPKPDDDNPRGFYEDQDLTELVDFKETGYIDELDFTTILRYYFITRKSLAMRWGFKVHRIVRYYDQIRSLCPEIKVILCTREHKSNIDSIVRCYNMEKSVAERYAEIMNKEIQAVLDAQDVLEINLERSIHNHMGTINNVVEYCELGGIQESCAIRALFFLGNYKDYDAWPIGKQISIPVAGGSDEGETRGELQRTVYTKLRTTGG